MKRLTTFILTLALCVGLCTFSASATASGTVGDVNFDGIINSLDAAQVLKHDAMLIAFDADALAAADVNGDGVANSLDATQILKHDAGLINIITGEILEGNRVLVQLSYATDEMINNTADYEHYTETTDYINGHFCFSASEDVQDFTIYSLTDPGFMTYRAVYSLDILRTDKPLIASVYYGDMFTDVAISYYKDGVFYFYGLVYSGFDGSVSLQDIEYSIEY